MDHISSAIEKLLKSRNFRFPVTELAAIKKEIHVLM